MAAITRRSERKAIVRRRAIPMIVTTRRTLPNVQLAKFSRPIIEHAHHSAVHAHCDGHGTIGQRQWKEPLGWLSAFAAGALSRHAPTFRRFRPAGNRKNARSGRRPGRARVGSHEPVASCQRPFNRIDSPGATAMLHDSSAGTRRHTAARVSSCKRARFQPARHIVN